MNKSLLELLAARLGGVLLGCSAASVAWGGVTWNPYAKAAAEYDSNVFSLSSPEQAALDNGDARRGDTVERYLAGLGVAYSDGAVQLGGAAEGRHFNYQHFSRLDHDESLLTGSAVWKAASLAETSLDYRQEWRMEPFDQRSSTELSMERERSIQGRVSLSLGPEWRLEPGMREHRLDSPQPGQASFGLHERSGSAALRYLGYGGAQLGLYAEYLLGGYVDVPQPASFRQSTAELTAAYAESGLSAFDGKLGYVLRSGRDGQGDRISGMTGVLGYTRFVSAKTAIDLRLFRNLSSYAGSASSLLETGASLGVRWQPTFKLSFAPRYAWTAGNYSALGSAAGVSGRHDHVQFAELLIEYRPLDWLSLRPYLRYQDRSSNQALDSFNRGLYGLELRADLGSPRP